MLMQKSAIREMKVDLRDPYQRNIRTAGMISNNFSSGFNSKSSVGLGNVHKPFQAELQRQSSTSGATGKHFHHPRMSTRGIPFPPTHVPVTGQNKILSNRFDKNSKSKKRIDIKGTYGLNHDNNIGVLGQGVQTMSHSSLHTEGTNKNLLVQKLPSLVSGNSVNYNTPGIGPNSALKVIKE